MQCRPTGERQRCSNEELSQAKGTGNIAIVIIIIISHCCILSYLIMVHLISYEWEETATSSSHPQNCHFGKFFKLPVLLHDGESTFSTQRQTFPPKSIDADYPRVNWDQLLCMAGCWWSSESSLHCADHWGFGRALAIHGDDDDMKMADDGRRQWCNW